MSEREDTAVFPELLRGGEILFNVLPKQFRNLDLAELLLDRAVKSEPMNSKVNHKFACFLVLVSFYIIHVCFVDLQTIKRMFSNRNVNGKEH